MTVGIAGAGSVGAALARALREAGESVVAIASRDIRRAQAAADFAGGEIAAVPFASLHCDVAIICVPDPAIPDVARQIPTPAIALHTAGAHGPEILVTLPERGAACGCLHPLQTFPSPEAGWRTLPGIFYGVDGDTRASLEAERLARLLRGTPVRVPAERRALYHAASATASNLLVALAGAAAEMLHQAIPEHRSPLEMLAPLMRASLENAIANGTAGALTGPVRRGDAETIANHREALQPFSTAIREFYDAGSSYALEIAQQAGLDPTAAGRIHCLLTHP